jgi:hypothetical protein
VRPFSAAHDLVARAGRWPGSRRWRPTASPADGSLPRSLTQSLPTGIGQLPNQPPRERVGDASCRNPHTSQEPFEAVAASDPLAPLAQLQNPISSAPSADRLAGTATPGECLASVS